MNKIDLLEGDIRRISRELSELQIKYELDHQPRWNITPVFKAIDTKKIFMYCLGIALILIGAFKDLIGFTFIGAIIIVHTMGILYGTY